MFGLQELSTIVLPIKNRLYSPFDLLLVFYSRGKYGDPIYGVLSEVLIMADASQEKCDEKSGVQMQSEKLGITDDITAPEMTKG